MANILIVGYGFVGGAVEHGFTNDANTIFIADPKLGTQVSDFTNNNLDVVFICVPTPMSDTGEIDVSIVDRVLLDLAWMKDTIIVLKSTVTPQIVAAIASVIPNFVYNPEFLTERNAFDDFVNPIHHVFGGDPVYTHKLEQFYKDYSNCNKTKSFHMTAPEASFVKYGMNTFLMTKVVFFNQLYELCSRDDVDYNTIVAAIGNDPRVGKSHTVVPGADGKFGASGSCFPKDATAFIAYSEGISSVLNEAWNVNCDYRNSGELLDREKAQNVKFVKIPQVS